MAAAAFRTRRTGVARRVAAMCCTRSVVGVIMAVLLTRSRRSRSWNSGRGRSRSIASMRESEYSGIALLPGCSVAAAGLGFLHLPPQRFERAELELFHGAFALPESFGGLADAPPVDEPRGDDRALIRRQRI